MKKPSKLKYLTICIVALLLANLAGCSSNAQNTLPPVRSIADIAETATPSITYIEAWDSEDPDHRYIGSGFVISNDGMVVTSYHVLQGSDQAMLEVDGRQYFDVSVLAYDASWDLALLKVEADNLQPLKLATGIKETRLGEEVLAMGNPEGFKQTVSDGIISNLSRRLEGYDFDHIQTTAMISKGSSGGPLLNMHGEVIGLNNLTYGQSLNFAVPVDFINKLILNAGQPLNLADAFESEKTKKPAQLDHLTDQLAVVLTWEGSVDLDLEIWTEDFQYLGCASVLGESPDITDGAKGEEWFVFEKQPIDFNGDTIDFSTGRYVVSAYYFGPEPDDGIGAVDATVKIIYPDGRVDIAQKGELWYSAPYDQWFAMLIDVDSQEYKILDLFFDAPIVALLEWDTSEDLDLLIFDEKNNEFLHSTDFWYGHDYTSGLDGIEVFRFSSGKSNSGEFHDFSEGVVDIVVAMNNTVTRDTNAKVYLITNEYETVYFEHKVTADPAGDYVWHVVYGFDLETLSYSLPSADERRIYLDE